ncbi:ATP-binding protein [Neobacillus sp. PS3-40]|uniref:ATP-binding protein n=1 Tax=Neobacillus sp. PS3-40 TaxID=3070679 RepID=UPI0027E1D1C2|nr:ATP-binding protein [Neobacillus sp. PS3-40]WML45949.1 ATP-binding protein [Neobacillus sp. PS3-40]
MDKLLNKMGKTFNIDHLVMIFNFLEDMVFLVEVGEDGVFRYLEVNPAYLKGTGIPLKDLKNKHIDEVFESREAALVMNNYKKAIMKKKALSYEENVKIYRQYKTFETTIIPIFLEEQGVCRYILGVSRDISERKRYEDLVTEAKSELTAIVQPQQGVIIEVEKRGVDFFYTNCEGPLLGQFGLTPQEVINRRPQDLFPPEMTETIIEQYQLCWSTKEKIFYEWAGKAIKDEFCWLAILTPILENGEITSFIIYAIDILERKKAEESLMKAEKLSLIGELAAGVGHEIRNPLTSIRGFMKYMRQNKEEIRDEYFDIIDSELESLNQIAGELMILAKPQVMQFEKHDLIKLLNEVVFLLEAEAFSYGVRMIKKYQSSKVWIYGERHQLKQVFINLMKNALDAMREQSYGKLIIECEQTDSLNLVKISDNGIGIPEEILGKIGEPFYTTKEKGTGLGLMVSYRIIKNHKGSIVCKSEVGKGTSFSMSFPKIQKM